MTVGVDGKRNREDSVDIRAVEGKWRMTVTVAIKWTISMAAGETILNSLIKRVAFREIVQSGLGLQWKLY